MNLYLSKNSVRIFFVLILAFALIPNFQIYAQSSSDIDTSVLYTTTVLEISLDIMTEELENGDAGATKRISKINTEIFPLQLQTLRQADSEITDEIHILLLDIHSNIGISSSEELLTNISVVKDLLKTYEIGSPDYKKTIAEILIIVDEQYQIAINEDDQTLYQFSVDLMNSSFELFGEADFNQRLALEIESFMIELQDKIKNKDNFVSIGTLITTINRDLVGTETTGYDKHELYDTIRKLYKELVVAVNDGDYTTAEELAIEAYLENFEYLEADIEEVDSDLLYTLEIDMREELRNMIKNKQDSETIRIFLEDTILPDLYDAEQKVQTLVKTDTANEALDEEFRTAGGTTEQEKSSVKNEIDFIRDTLQVMLVQYRQGDYQSAYTSARTAYLDSYEFVEIPLRTIDPDFTLEVEFQFAELRNMIKQQEDYDKVQEIAIEIKRNLDESERIVIGTGTLAPSIAFTSSFVIIFREGLESVLILGAIMTYLEASRNSQFKKYIYYGIIAAFGATAVTWIIASYIIEISGANRELIEAIAALSATAVLFYVSFWVLNKIEHKKWMEFVKAKVWQATTTGSVMVFVMLSFFTVYREGFETVLFYQAMSGFAKHMEGFVGLGFVFGIVSLLGIYYIMRKLGKKLPLRALFGLTMGVGAYLSIAFLGNAIRELQVLEIVPYTGMIGIIPRLDINLAAMTGIYPTLETVIGQIILLSIYLIAIAHILILKPRRERQILASRKSRQIDENDNGTA